MKSKVSIIITTKNSSKTLEALLKSIKEQSYYQNIEFIVVDNNSSDYTVKIAKKYTKKVFQKGPERSSQRNYGVLKSIGDFILILDADMVLTKRVVEECVKMINSSQYGGIIIPEKSFGENFWAKVKAWEREINEGEGYFEAARFFPKKIIEEFKGYEEDLTGPEDWDLPQKISKKYKIGRIKSYILHNEGKTSIINLMKKKYYYGLSADRYLKKQNLSPFTAKTVYFLRPAFYKNWLKLISHPILTLAMFLMLTLETLGGGVGYLIGKFKHEN